MIKEEFIKELEKLGFKKDNLVEEMYVFGRCSPTLCVYVHENTAFGTYSYGGDTGPIELTGNSPPYAEQMKFDEALEALLEHLR